MLWQRFVVSIFLPGTMVLGAGVVCGQNYPNSAIRIVTHGPGGGGDFVARLVAQGLTGNLGQPVIVDNRGGNFPAEIVAKATPDGYTVLLTAGSFTTGPLLQKMPYDPMKDFSPIVLTSRSPNILVVHPSVPVKSVKELIALAKAKPGELNYAAGAIGGAAHLATELFKAMAGVNIVHIPYKSSSQESADLVGGQVQVSFGSAAQVGSHIKSGRVRALAVTSAQPSVLFPGLPTVAASGLPGYQTGMFTWMFAPARTPEAIIKRLNQEVGRVLNLPDVKQKFFDSGAEVVGGSPEEVASLMKSETAMWGKLIRDAGIKVD